MRLPKQNIVIFGGPDRCGKTTIAKELSKVIDAPYFKPTGQQKIAMQCPEVFRNQTQWGEPKLLDFIKQTGASAVMDRGFPCDWAYSRVLGRETAWETIDDLDRGYARLNSFLVFTLRKDYSKLKPDEFKKIDPETTQMLDEEYQIYAEISNIPALVLFTDDEDLTRQIHTILHFMEETCQSIS